MLRFVLTLSLTLLLGGCASTQRLEEPLVIQVVQPVEGEPAADVIFEALESYFVTQMRGFNRDRMVIDRAAGRIVYDATGRHAVGAMGIPLRVDRSVTIEVRDGRFRYTSSGFTIVVTSPAYVESTDLAEGQAAILRADLEAEVARMADYAASFDSEAEAEW